jgi:hypothetical protein
MTLKLVVWPVLLLSSLAVLIAALWQLAYPAPQNPVCFRSWQRVFAHFTQDSTKETEVDWDLVLAASALIALDGMMAIRKHLYGRW